jgi:hypothetical protein
MTRDAANGWQHSQVPRPSVIEIYNKFMGGTDRWDQYNCYYSYKHDAPHNYSLSDGCCDQREGTLQLGSTGQEQVDTV